MKSKVSLVALRIAAIKEEFSENEIIEAVKLLEQKGSSSALLSYLTERIGQNREIKEKRITNRKSKPIEDQRSKALIELERKDPEKYRVLFELDSLLRKSIVLPEVEDIKRVGERLNKRFSTRSSRRESISKLMALLVERPIEEIKELIRIALLTTRTGEEDSDYQKLAQFIITGKTAHSEKQQLIDSTPSTQR